MSVEFVVFRVTDLRNGCSTVHRRKTIDKKSASLLADKMIRSAKWSSNKNQKRPWWNHYHGRTLNDFRVSELGRFVEQEGANGRRKATICRDEEIESLKRKGRYAA